MSTATDLAFLFSRDLTRLGKQIEAFPNDEALWQTLPGVLNPAGNLALHIEGESPGVRGTTARQATLQKKSRA